MSKWKIAVIISIVILLAFGGYQVYSAGAKKSASEKIIKPEVKTLTQKISASGKIIAEKQIDLKFQTSGLLTWVGVKEGDLVKEWQAVASLDKRDLEKKLIKALRDYSKSRWDFEEDKNDTYKNQIITDTVKRILEKNQFDLDKAVIDVEIADIALKFSTLISPINGIVTHIDIPVSGVNITPASATFTVADPDSLVFNIDIDESDIGSIKENQNVLITLDAYPDEEIKGKVSKIGFVSKTTSGGGNAFPIEVKLPNNKNLRYKIGMNGDATILIKEISNVLSLPLSAVTKENNKSYVFVKENNISTKKEIKTGLEDEENIQILKGLGKNDEVVIESK